MSPNLDNSAVAKGLEKVSFHSNLKEDNDKECSNYHTIALISHDGKVMLKILQARLQQHELRTSRYTSWIQKGQKNQISNCQHPLSHRKSKGIPEKKKSTSASLTILKLLTVDHNKLWKILQEMGIPDHVTCLLRNLCRSGSNSQNQTWNNGLVQNWDKSTSRLYIITLLI